MPGACAGCPAGARAAARGCGKDDVRFHKEGKHSCRQGGRGSMRVGGCICGQGVRVMPLTLKTCIPEHLHPDPPSCLLSHQRMHQAARFPPSPTKPPRFCKARAADSLACSHFKHFLQVVTCTHVRATLTHTHLHRSRHQLEHLLPPEARMSEEEALAMVRPLLTHAHPLAACIPSTACIPCIACILSPANHCGL